MRKIFLLLSVMLLFIGMTLANAPSTFVVDENEPEYIIFQEAGQVIEAADGIVMLIPAFVEMESNLLTVQSPEVIDIGCDLFNANYEIYAQLLVPGCLFMESAIQFYGSYNRLPAKNKTNLITGTSRLDIGETATQNSRV